MPGTLRGRERRHQAKRGAAGGDCGDARNGNRYLRPSSKSVEEFAGQSFDSVITVCDSARETCPVFFGSAKRLHHSFEDPAALDGSEEERLAAFRRVRDQLRAYLGEFAQRESAGSRS